MGAKKTLLVTRPEPENRETVRLLRRAGFNTRSLALLEFEALGFEPPAPGEFGSVAVTSTNALRALEEQDLIRDLRPLPLFAVGEKTAERAKTLGFCDIRAAGGSVASLAALIAAYQPGGGVFYPCARHVAGDLAAMLSGHEIIVETVPVYQMKALQQLNRQQCAMLTDGLIDAALFYSRRTGQVFIRLCADAGVEALDMAVLCLSQNVAAVFRAAGFTRIEVAGAPNQQAMMALALSFGAINSK